jgi:hypothetical protein
MTEVQVIEVMKADIQKRVGNVSVLIYGRDLRDPVSIEPLPLIYYLQENNIVFKINEKSHEIRGSCTPSLACFLNNQENVLDSVDGKLFYIVDGSYSGEGKSAPAYYYVDAMNGDILWSYIGEDVYPELER